MRIREQNVARRTVIEVYAAYDRKKKDQPAPRFDGWDWTVADRIDVAMCAAGLKIGVPAGYLLWDKVELTLSDLRECAVVAAIFPGQSRKLGLVDRDQFSRCKPGRWYEHITHGRTFDEDAPVLLRPATRGEYPARYYIEDGSGRAVTLLANQHLFAPSQVLAIGYLGRVADSSSWFMQQKFPELL